MNESDLVRGLREHSPAAVQYLSDCYLPSIWRYVYVRVGGDRHLAEDLVSETVLALLRAAAAPDAAIDNLEGWLRSVAGNKVVDHFRAAARVQHLIEHTLPVVAIEVKNDPAGRQEIEEQRAEVRRVMDAMSSRQRLVLEWKYLDKLSVRDIGERLQLSEKAAESILFRARREFRDRLKQGRRDPSQAGPGDQGLGDEGLDEAQTEQSDDIGCASGRRFSAQNPGGATREDEESTSTEVRVAVNSQDDTAHR